MQAPSTFFQSAKPCLSYLEDLGGNPVALRAARLTKTMIGFRCAPRGRLHLLPHSILVPTLLHRRRFPSSCLPNPHEPPHLSTWTKSTIYSLMTLLTWLFAMRLSIPRCRLPTTCWSIPKNILSIPQKMVLRKTTSPSSTPTVWRPRRSSHKTCQGRTTVCFRQDGRAARNADTPQMILSKRLSYNP